MKKKKKDDLEQYKDIRVADMNVEGMPWYIKKTEDGEAPGSSSDGFLPKETLTPKETRNLIGSALLAALLIGGIMLFVFFLLILFCVYIWF